MFWVFPCQAQVIAGITGDIEAVGFRDFFMTRPITPVYTRGGNMVTTPDSNSQFGSGAAFSADNRRVMEFNYTGDGFVAGLSTEFSSTVVIGSVIRQDPVGDTLANYGSTVVVVISSGPLPELILRNGFEE